MKKLKNDSGVTIAELMIYIVLGLIVVGFALKAMTDMSKGYTRTRTVMKMQKDGRDAIQVMAREIANTGFKYYIHDTTVAVRSAISGGFDTKPQTFYTTRPTKIPVVYSTNAEAGSTNPPRQLVLSSQLNWLRATYCGTWNWTSYNIPAGKYKPALSNDPIDESKFGESNAPAVDSAASFRFRNIVGARSDTLIFYAAQLNRAGNRIVSVSKTVYWLNTADSTVMRLVQQPDEPDLNIDSRKAEDDDGAWGDASTPTTMALIDRVVALQFMFSKDGINWDNDPTTDNASLSFDAANERHLIKMIKIQMVVASDKTQKNMASPNIPANTIGDINVEIPANNRLLRTYEKIVEIPNNGVLID